MTNTSGSSISLSLQKDVDNNFKLYFYHSWFATGGQVNYARLFEISIKPQDPLSINIETISTTSCHPYFYTCIICYTAYIISRDDEIRSLCHIYILCICSNA